MSSVLFRNIGTLLSGYVEKPLMHADSVFVRDGVITEIGTQPEADTIVDVRGATLTPGLWDAHHHPYFGEYTPRAEGFNVVSRTVRSGTTTLVSAGPAHQPGMYLPSARLPNVQAHSRAPQSPQALARDAVGTQALAIVSAAAWQQERPMGVKCYAGTVIAETGLQPEHFRRMAAAGVQRLKFLRPLPSSAECQQMCEWARQAGMLVLTHTGGRALIQDTRSIRASLEILQPDVACHVNGGPTPPPLADVDWLVDETNCVLDLVFHGNMRIAQHVLRRVGERGELHRVVIGTDSPSAGGVNPGGVLRTVTLLANLTDMPPEVLLCMATGNTARGFRLPGGRIEVGQPADLVVWDPIDGSVTTDMLGCVAYGDMAVPGLVMIDGAIRMHGDPRAIDARRMPLVEAAWGFAYHERW
ncbi:MAG: amidohydrolase family protein [Chloroflexi bacterium]|nr:amidohydrolase family protein [Chloroflexota bacterium]